MQYRGRQLDFRAMWEVLGVSIPANDSGTFSRLLPCPYHQRGGARTPSFEINMRQPTQHCFSRCGISGNYEHAVQLILGCSSKDARRFILGYTTIGGAVAVDEIRHGLGNRKTITADSALALDAQRLNSMDFTYLPKAARAYLDSRKIQDESRGTWEIGWDEEAERLVIPGYDNKGVMRFLIRRAIDGRKPKYLYTDGAIKQNVLFGLLHVPAAARTLVLVEGSLDVIRLHQIGVREAVGTLGSGLSDRQVRLIYERNPTAVFTFFDRDEAGARNTLDACEKLSRVPLYVCRFPRGRNDPAEFLPVEARRAIGNALPRHQFLLRVEQVTRTTTSRKRREYA